jgi:hypothetical protein
MLLEDLLVGLNAILLVRLDSSMGALVFKSETLRGGGEQPLLYRSVFEGCGSCGKALNAL